MDLTTSYMGLKLKNPIIVSSNSLTASIDNIKKCANKGAGAIVLKSLFEEQLITTSEKLETYDHKYYYFPEAVDYINKHAKGKGVQEYLKLIKEAKKAVEIPVIASINCITDNEWPEFAKKLEEAGADGLELNIAIIPFSGETACDEIEQKYVDIISAVKKHINIPLAVKMGSYFTNPVKVAERIIEAGADSLVVFNRFLRPDIDIDKKEITTEHYLSAPEEMTESLRWVSVMKSKLNCQIAGATGIHDAEGVIKQLMAGADATQICSTLHIHGISYIETILERLEKWMVKNEYKSIRDFKDSMLEDHEKSSAFMRVQFMKRSIEE